MACPRMPVLQPSRETLRGLGLFVSQVAHLTFFFFFGGTGAEALSSIPSAAKKKKKAVL
jgi:hypothetical protein